MRRLRQSVLLLAVLVMVLLLAACGNDAGETTDEPTGAAEEPTEVTETGAAETEPTDGEEESSSIVPLDQVCEEEFAGVEAPDDFRVGLVTDIGSVDDGTFNQYAYEGMVAAAECFGFETNFIETTNEADYENNIDAILQDDPNVVVTVGFLIADATLQAAQNNADIKFIGVDQFQEDYGDNYSGVLFREDQGGFLAGAMAGLLTESQVVGVVGGREDVPPVVRLVNGYRAGAHYIDENIQVLETYNQSFTDPAKGRSDAEQFLGEGADVIFGAGGPTGSGGVRAAAEAGAWGIGVDQDEYFTTFNGGSAPGSDRLATSAVKRVDLGVFEQIAAAIQDQFEGGIFTLEASNDGITYAPFHDADIPDDVATQLEEIRQGLADGSIETGIDPITGEPLE